MKVQKSFRDKTASSKGQLFLVPTPIGNLSDMTFRAVEMLKTVDYIAAEDTRNTGLLLKHFEIETAQISLHEHNWKERVPQLLTYLESGKSIAQVSDAGMPSISDPGHELVEAAIAADIDVIALPGASAGLTALIASGLAPEAFSFYGFLPRKASQQQAFFESKKNQIESQIFYESPLRLTATLSNMLAVYGDRQTVIARELTKIYEEYRRGSLSELIAALAEEPRLKGECVLLVAGAGTTEAPVKVDDEISSLLDEVQTLINAGSKPNEAIKQVAKARQINRQELYADFHKLS